MKPIPFFSWISLVIIPVQLFAQKDTLKANWGINSLQIGVAQPVDVSAYYNKRLPPSFFSKNSNYKKLKIKRTSFHFVRVDSIFLLKSISIKPSAKKFYVQAELTISKRTKVKDLVAALDTPRMSHLGQFNSVIYKSTIFRFNGFRAYVKPVKGDLKSSETYTFKIKKKFFEKIGIKIIKFKIGIPQHFTYAKNRKMGRLILPAYFL